MGHNHNTILRAILAEYGTRPDMRIWPASVGAARYGGRLVRFGVAGQADLTGILRLRMATTCPRCEAVFYRPHDGVRLEVEVKAGADTQRREQGDYEKMVTRFGGIYVLARSAGDVARAINARQEGIVASEPTLEQEGMTSE